MADSLQKGAYSPDSYLANTVLTSALLNNDNTLEASSFNILLQMIGDVDGEIAANSSPTMINSLGRAIGSMGLINPIFPMDFTAVQALYVANGELHTAPGNKIMLDFVPSSFTSISINGGASIHASPAPTRAQMDGTTYKWYTEAGSRYIEFYDDITTNVVVKYTPSATFTNSPFQHQAGFNVMPTLADIANGAYATLTSTGPSTATITFPANISNIIDMSAATPSAGSKASFIKLTGNIPYALPRFITDAYDQTVGGGFGGATIPSTAISFFLIDGTTVKNKINASFTFSLTGPTTITVNDGGSGVLASLVTTQRLAVVFSQGEAVAQTAAYVKSFALKHDHGANGGQQISFLDLADTRPGSMGLANIADSVIPMHVMPQTLHRGGFTTTAPNIDGNAFIGDLRLSNGVGTNTTLLSDYAPGTSLNLYLNSLSTDWATLTGGTKVGKLSSINGGNIDYVLFGNGYSIFDDRVTIGPNGILDVVGVEPTDDETTPTHGINFFDSSGAVKSKIGVVNKNILGTLTDITQFTGKFNFSLTDARGTGFRRRFTATTNHYNYGMFTYYGIDFLDSPKLVQDVASIGIIWRQNPVGRVVDRPRLILGANTGYDETGVDDPSSKLHCEIYSNGGLSVGVAGVDMPNLVLGSGWSKTLLIGRSGNDKANAISFEDTHSSANGPIGIGVTPEPSSANRIYIIRNSTDSPQEQLYPMYFRTAPSDPEIVLRKYSNGHVYQGASVTQAKVWSGLEVGAFDTTTSGYQSTGYSRQNWVPISIVHLSDEEVGGTADAKIVERTDTNIYGVYSTSGSWRVYFMPRTF